MVPENESMAASLFEIFGWKKTTRPQAPVAPKWMKESAVRARRYSDARREWPTECCGSSSFLDKLRGANCVSRN